MKVFWKESNFKRVLVGKVGRKLSDENSVVGREDGMEEYVRRWK